MSRYVKVRKFSRIGRRTSGFGWLIILIGCSVPVVQPWPTGALLLWNLIGYMTLSKNTSLLELQTVSGLLKWGGLFAVWPMTIKVGASVLVQPDEWSTPPTEVVDGAS